jgi:hypothetical protein
VSDKLIGSIESSTVMLVPKELYDTLQAKLDQAVWALEFYASSEAYTVPAIQPKDISECSYDNIIKLTVFSVTQKARETLHLIKGDGE